MTTAVLPKTYVAGADILAADVNQNFDYLKSFINTNSVDVDASKAFTAIPSGPSADPTTANQFTRKSYVDRVQTLMSKTSTATSLYADASARTSMSFLPTAFIMPTCSAAHPLQISLWVPEFTVGNDAGGGVAVAGMGLHLYIYVVGGACIAHGQSIASNGYFIGTESPSLYMQRTFYDNTLYAAGTSMSLDVYGRVALAQPGKFAMNGGSESPLEFAARLL